MKNLERECSKYQTLDDARGLVDTQVVVRIQSWLIPMLVEDAAIVMDETRVRVCPLQGKGSAWLPVWQVQD